MTTARPGRRTGHSSTSGTPPPQDRKQSLKREVLRSSPSGRYSVNSEVSTGSKVVRLERGPPLQLQLLQRPAAPSAWDLIRDISQWARTEAASRTGLRRIQGTWPSDQWGPAPSYDAGSGFQRADSCRPLPGRRAGEGPRSGSGSRSENAIWAHTAGTWRGDAGRPARARLVGRYADQHLPASWVGDYCDAAGGGLNLRL